MVVCTRVSTHTAPIPSVHINLHSDKVNLRFAFSMPPKARKSKTRSKRKESTCRTPRGSDPKNLRSQKVTPQRKKKDKCCCCNGPDREGSLGEGNLLRHSTAALMMDSLMRGRSGWCRHWIGCFNLYGRIAQETNMRSGWGPSKVGMGAGSTR